MHMIDDLYAYFTQPWMSAVYHEPFDDMINDLQMEEVVLVKIQGVSSVYGI